MNPTTYTEKMEQINAKLQEKLSQYQEGGARDQWKKNFLHSLEQLKKMQASDAISALASSVTDTPFDRVINEVRQARSQHARHDACKTLSELNDKLCTINGNEKLCLGMNKAMNALSCSEER